jgi:ABC transport system ATP-binding/permease protein
MKKVLIIGSGPECDLVIDDPRVSGRHCQLVQTPHGLEITDLNSTNGTFIRGVRITLPVAVQAKDEILLAGHVKLPWDTVLETLPVTSPAPAGPQHDKSKGLIIGRDETCDHVIDLPSISRQHARLISMGEYLFLEDLNSANGTFVNGQRITSRVPIRQGDVVGFGTHLVELQFDGHFRPLAAAGAVALELRHIDVRVPGRKLLEDVSLSIYPGEFVALMGSSGVGKSSLIHAMNGYAPPAQGQVLVNGIDLYEHYADFANTFGYLLQDDIMHSELTVGQALYYTARLRLPSNTTDREIAELVHKVAGQLGLEAELNTLIGSPERKGISGGQRKRVNLAMELLTDPAVLFLDEPTSGLSSEDALNVMKLLREQANHGKTVVMTIHQPNLEAYRMLDKLIVLCRDANNDQPGRLAFFGPAFPDAITFLNPRGAGGANSEQPPHPDELLRGLARGNTALWD